MNNQTIVCCVVALLLGMLLANMLKNVCGCKVVEGQGTVAGRQVVHRDQCERLLARSEFMKGNLNPDDQATLNTCYSTFGVGDGL